MDVEELVDEIFGVVEVKSDVMASKPSIVPQTPDCSRESGHLIHGFATPLKLLSLDCNRIECSFSPPVDGSVTPKDCLFDPLAQEPEKFMLAPARKKISKGSREKVVRRLNFSCALNLITKFDAESNSGIVSDEDRLSASLYPSTSDAVISEQAKEFVEEVPAPALHLDGFGKPRGQSRIPRWVGLKLEGKNKGVQEQRPQGRARDFR